VSGIRRDRIERNAKNGFLPVPRPECAKLPDNVELRQRPSGVLPAPDSRLRLRQVSRQVDDVSAARLPVWDSHRELAMRDLELDWNCVPRLEHRRENSALVRAHDAASPIDDRLRKARATTFGICASSPSMASAGGQELHPCDV
jgi:hypothetical protein